jgi:hypothetical protein
VTQTAQQNKSREQHRHAEHSIGNPLKITRANGEQNHKLSVPTDRLKEQLRATRAEQPTMAESTPAGHSSEWFKWRSSNEWQRK